MSEKKFKDHIVSALIHFSFNFFIYFIYIVPFDLWKKATVRLANQRESGGLKISKIVSLWPFLSFLKAFILDFLLDGVIFISYILAPIFGIYSWIDTGDFISFVIYLAYGYFTPVGLSLVRDILQLLTLPFKKFLSWAAKPAQYMDLEIKNK